MTALQFIADIKWWALIVVLLIIGARKWAAIPESTKKELREAALRRGWKVGLGGNTLEVTPETAQVLAAATASDAELAAQLPAQAPGPDADAAQTEAELVQQQRREYIEEIMRSTAEWGWKMAQAGHLAPPQPFVDWSTGEPKIMFGMSTYPIQYGGPPLTFQAPPIVFHQPGKVPDEAVE